jgi:hypothetical protein
MGDILDGSADYDLVRQLMGVDTAVVTDAKIESEFCLPYVEAVVKDAYSDWSTYKTENALKWKLMRKGTACLVAFTLTHWLSTESAHGGGRFSIGPYAEDGNRPVVYEEAVVSHRSCAYQSLSLLDSKIGRTTKPTAVIFYGPTAGKANVPSDSAAWYEKIIPPILDNIETQWWEDG